MSDPTPIETRRLSLRRMTTADADALVALQADPLVSRFIPVDRPFDRAHAVERLRVDDDDWARRGHGMLAIVETETGRFLGRAALKYWPHLDETEVGWALREDARGQGFATEAARACVAWGFEAFSFEYLIALIRPDNLASMTVAQRLGMTSLRSDVLFGDPVVVHWLKREDWAAGG